MYLHLLFHLRRAKGTPGALSFTTLTLPPPSFCLFDLVTGWSVFECDASVFVCVCAAPCASLVVPPRGLWVCVLPRGHLNVNVNVPSSRLGRRGVGDSICYQ